MGTVTANNPGLPNGLWYILDGGLWHATSPDNLVGIVDEREIQVRSGRYDGSFAKSLGAVSLFDFGPSSRDDWGQFDNWAGWFGHQQNCRVSIWLEIDRCATAFSTKDAGLTHQLWTEGERRTLIPGVEACHVGPVALKAVIGVVAVDRYDRSLFREMKVSDTLLNEVRQFEQGLPDQPPESPIVAALRDARAQRHGTLPQS